MRRTVLRRDWIRLGLALAAILCPRQGSTQPVLPSRPVTEAGALTEGVLDVAVDTSAGPWCSAPSDALVAAGVSDLTVEGWARAGTEPSGTVLELSSREGSLALVLDGARALRIEAAGEVVVTALSLQPESWTHIRLEVAATGLRLDTWSSAEGERTFTASIAWPRTLHRFALCAGGRGSATDAFHGWVDEVRLWSGRLEHAVSQRWRDRRLSDRHPLRERLLGEWPLSAGRGEKEAGTGILGPLTSREGRWISLPTLVYGPLLRDARPDRVGVIVAARRSGESRRPWKAAVEFWPAEAPENASVSAPITVLEDTDFVAHVTVEGLAAQAHYIYVPLIDGRRAIDGESLLAFHTPPSSTLNFDFAAAFLADIHADDTVHAPALYAGDVARRLGALFWAQLGDVMSGSVDGTPEERRTTGGLRALWERNFGTSALPQVQLSASVPLNLATISDHEVADNYSMNWHHGAYQGVPRESSSLGNRIAQYDLSIASWRHHFGERLPDDDLLGQAALTDFGQSVMGVRYEHHGLYHSYRPAPFVEFFVLDTTSYRGDPYQSRRWHAREANRDTDHSRYPWGPANRGVYIFGDRAHGATEQTDGVRSWLGPAQEAAFLSALRVSTARVLVIAAGYPLYSLKFEGSDVYWPARESGFDFAADADRIMNALVASNRLVLWVHGDGHSPALVKLRPNVYQLQVGATFLSGPSPGHHARSLRSGERSTGDLLGGGELVAGHQPDFTPDDESHDLFRGGLDQFEGFLRLYFHPGRELLRSSERQGLSRGRTDREVVIRSGTDPANARAASLVVGTTARVLVRGRAFFSKVVAYGHEHGAAVITLADPVVSSPPEELRILIDEEPWVRADWFDSAGKPWIEFSAVLRRSAGSVSH